jgi:radical SAM superfamily enzyme YgiQ (UPF0313 family)/SAM-dependent methyltransferase
MRVLLIVPTASYATAYPAFLALSDFPAGFAYLASALRDAGHEVVGLNPNNDPGYASAREMIASRIGACLSAAPPDLVGVGGLCTDFAFLVDAIAILRERAPGVPIVLGGGIVNNDADFIFRTLRPDFCILGEGEEILVRLADEIGRGEADYERIPNLGYWAGGEPRFTRQDFDYGDIDKRSFPDYSPFDVDAMLDDHSYAARYLYRYTRPNPRPMTIVAARHCPFSCTFCVHRSGIRYQARSVANIIEEIRRLYERYAFNVLVILDELFAVDKKRLKEFCEALTAARERWGWDFDWLFQTHASASLDEATLTMAKNAGCYYFSYGLESASPKVLASMNKRTSPSQIAEAAAVAEKVGIGFGGNFIFGDIAETPETIVETVEFFSRHCRDAHIFFADVKPYPGSRLFDHCIEKGIIKDKLLYYRTIDRVLYNMTSMDDATWSAMLGRIFSLASYDYVKPAEVGVLSREEPPRERPGKVPGKASVWRIGARCPHCAREVRYAEPIDDALAGTRNLALVTGCRACNKRIRINLPASAMAACGARGGPDGRQDGTGHRIPEHAAGSGRRSLLYLSLEFPAWRQARSWSYSANLGFEEGFRANGIDVLTIPAMHGAQAASPASLLRRIRDLCAGRRFDQAWIELVHSPLDEELLSFLATLAPVRVGILGESLRYRPEAYEEAPHLRERSAAVEGRLRYMTHALVGDERDAQSPDLRKLVKPLWWVSAVPERFIRGLAGPPAVDSATFHGALYGDRSRWLEHPSLTKLLTRPSPLEDATPYPGLFDDLNAAMTHALRGGAAVSGELLEAYMEPLRRIRRECFSLWLDGLRDGIAVVNLPTFVSAYAGRVLEGMAAGRPVISWEIPDRPRNRALFEDGEEILLFPEDGPGILADHIARLRSDPALAEKIASNARRKLFRFHTMEKRVRQILDWIETGREPVYSDAVREESLDRQMGRFYFLLGETRGEAEAAGSEKPAEVAARNLKESLQQRPWDPDLWLGVLRLAVEKNDLRTIETALQKILELCPNRTALLPALASLARTDSREIEGMLSRVREDIYYENLFLKDPSWSSPSPNADEEARWETIRRFVERILGPPPTNGAAKPRILDLGCGRGWLTHLASRYGNCEGIDPVGEVIKVARRHFPDLIFHVGTAGTILERPDFTPYDIVLSSEVIEHVPRDLQGAFVLDLHRLLKPGGTAILTTPRAEAYARWKEATAFVDQPIEEWLTEDELKDLFTMRGFLREGNDRIHIDLKTMTYRISPAGEEVPPENRLALYQVWALRRE